LEEIQPFLKKGGALAPYLLLEEVAPKSSVKLDQFRLESGAWYQKDFSILTNKEYLIEESVNPGVHSASYYLDHDGSDILVQCAEYNKKGKITTKVKYDYSGTETEDSTLYFYHSNGELKRIDYYDVQWDDDTIYCNVSYHYSDRGDITSIIYVDDDWSSFIDYFYTDHVSLKYFKDKAIMDGYVTSPMGTGLVDDGVEAFHLWEGYEIQRFNSHKYGDIQSLTKNGNKLYEERLYNKRDTFIVDLILEKDRVVAGNLLYQNIMGITVTYDKDGKPLSYSHTNSEGNTRNSYLVSRDKFGEVVNYRTVYTTSKGTRERVYKIVYDGSN
jgi:hypothetical protein